MIEKIVPGSWIGSVLTKDWLYINNVTCDNKKFFLAIQIAID